ncbi:MAG: endonuclease/exonuclease/phosphatase [Chitinophagales bacterium]|nr:endonuclease/exonuclease/phosphatase [Chitinophagales bacterium]
MKNLFLYFSLFLFSTQAFAQQQVRMATIGFYNLENLFDTINDPITLDDEFTPEGSKGYTSEVFLDKIEKLSDVISQIGSNHTPDGLAILGVAEIENKSVLETLVNSPKLKSRNYQIVHYNSPDLRGVDVGLLYNPKYFKVLNSESLRVPLKENGKDYFTRDILYVEGNFLGDPLFVFVNHWPSRRGGEEASAPNRAVAASVVKHKVDSLKSINPDYKIIIMGDLNDEPVSPSVSKVIGAKGNVKDLGRGDIFNPWVAFYKKGIGSSAYQDSWGLFDQVMLSTGFMKDYSQSYYFYKAEIFRRDFMLQKIGKYKGYPMRTFDGNKYIGGYSDHLPTFLIFIKPVN